MATRTITFNQFTFDEGVGTNPWINADKARDLDGVYATDVIPAAQSSNRLVLVSTGAPFAGLTGQIPVSVSFTGRLFTTNLGGLETSKMEGDYTYWTGVALTQIAAGNDQTFPTFTLTGTVTQRKAQLATWITSGIAAYFTVANGGVGPETASVDFFSFVLTTASGRNRRRAVGARRGASCNRS